MGDLLGRPIIVLPYGKPGCWDRVQAFVGRWLVRGLLVGIGVVIGVVVE